jgi:hypothetical protein
MKLSFALFGFAIFLCSGCTTQRKINPSGSDGSPVRDTVMSAGQVVVFQNPNGAGKIAYVSDFTRRYEINGGSYDVRLVQREKVFEHRNGIYNPGETWGPLPLKDATSSRFVVEESIVRFNTNEECERFFKEGAAYEKWVGGDSGLVLGFLLSPGRDQMNVSLYRCYIAGRLMRQMPSKFEYPGFVRVQ